MTLPVGEQVWTLSDQHQLCVVLLGMLPAETPCILVVAHTAAGPVIALAMGERGMVSRILAPKYGAHLTFGALSAGKASAPGQPLLTELKGLYGLPQQSPSTQVSGAFAASTPGCASTCVAVVL